MNRKHKYLSRSRPPRFVVCPKGFRNRRISLEFCASRHIAVPDRPPKTVGYASLLSVVPWLAFQLCLEIWWVFSWWQNVAILFSILSLLFNKSKILLSLLIVTWGLKLKGHALRL